MAVLYNILTITKKTLKNIPKTNNKNKIVQSYKLTYNNYSHIAPIQKQYLKNRKIKK